MASESTTEHDRLIAACRYVLRQIKHERQRSASFGGPNVERIVECFKSIEKALPEPILPCPHCGGPADASGTTVVGARSMEVRHHVVCTLCWASGSRHTSRVEAEDAWNRRAGQSTGEGDD